MFHARPFQHQITARDTFFAQDDTGELRSSNNCCVKISGLSKTDEYFVAVVDVLRQPDDRCRVSTLPHATALHTRRWFSAPTMRYQ
jgi:collagenase-like PrtC family protease